MGKRDVVNNNNGNYRAADGKGQSEDKFEAERHWIIQVKQRLCPEWKIRPLVSPSVSIYTISNCIRRFKPEAYIPQFVALGPYHRNINSQFSIIDDHKVEAVRRTLSRLNGITMEDLVAKVACLEREIRDSYEETRQYNGETLAWMFTVDGCFCLEYFRASFRTNEENHFSLIFEHAGNNGGISWDILQDIFKLENQIPLSVLITILHLELKRADLVAQRVIKMLWHVSEIPFNFSRQYSRRIVIREVKRHIIGHECGREVVRVRACHLLDLYSKILDSLLTDIIPTSEHPRDDGLKDVVSQWLHKSRTLRGISSSWLGRSTMDCWKNICSHLCPYTPTVEVDRYPLLPRPAVELQKAGIKFKASTKGEVRFERRWLGRAILFLPKMYIDEDTEPFVRNLMAFEDCRLAAWSTERPVFCKFMVFMNYLIDSDKDIALLREHEIMKSGMGRNEELAVIFNALCRGFPEDCGPFNPIVRQIRRHYTNRVNKWMNYFREHYCSTPCLVVSLFAATLFLCMTGVQTAYTILQYYSGINQE